MQELLIVFITIEATLLAAVGLLAVLVYISRKNSLLIHDINQLIVEQQQEDQESFDVEKAEQWFEKGDFKKLNHYCKEFISDTPNSVHANWYFALSHYNQGEYEVAKDYFEKVISINPLWRDGAVVYLQEIVLNMKNTSLKTLH